MRFPKILRVQNLLLVAIGLAAGIVLCAVFPTISIQVGKWINKKVEPPPPPPTVEQINQVLSGSQALVEAQYTYYVHVTRNGKFAADTRELGYRDFKGGTVMVSEVWNGSDAVPNPTPVHGYLFKVLPVAQEAGKKDGFAVVAHPADKSVGGRGWPFFLSIVPDAKGGIIGMTSRDTWEIEDAAAAAEIRSLLQRSRVNAGELDRFSPENFTKSYLIENFKKEIR
jgi:hypothetical protein